MTYTQTLDYIYAQLPMFSRLGADAFKKDLTNTIRLCEFLGNPQDRIRSVHVAGTNGKGSTSHMLAAIFQTAGYKTGLYTSPHLKDFRERIRIDGEMVAEQFVVDFIERLKPMIEEIQPSFFEITVAMAFEYFVYHNIDIAIIEVGLGGRFDSTNIITPELSVITNIGWDHMNLLGDTLEKIAYEKAGIIKKGVPVVVGETKDATAPVFKKKATEEHATLSFADEKRIVSGFNYEDHKLVVEVTKLHSDDKSYYHLDLPGLYQTRNLLTVLEAVKLMQQKEWQISEDQIRRALAEVKKLTGLHGRWETIHEHPAVILDVAHNEDGMRALASQLEFTTYHHLRIVIGMVKDKEIDHVLALLPASATYYFTRSQIPRALPENELAEKGAAAGLKGHHYPEVNAAIRAALDQADKDDLILVCGSLFVVGEVDRQAFLKS
jgi:dihydrofolate synthase/folylpolyglutamate synthase